MKSIPTMRIVMNQTVVGCLKIEPSGQKLMEVCVSGSPSPTKLMIVNGGGPRGIRIVGTNTVPLV